MFRITGQLYNPHCAQHYHHLYNNTAVSYQNMQTHFLTNHIFWSLATHRWLVPPKKPKGEVIVAVQCSSCYPINNVKPLKKLNSTNSDLNRKIIN